MAPKVDKTSNEHILEIRYRPNPRVLDNRGSWAEEISAVMELEHWQILENRLDVFSEGQTEHAFVGFRNAGFIASDTPTRNFFPDRAGKLFRTLFGLKEFGQLSFVERIGIRSKFCVPFEGTFAQLVDLVGTKYVQLTEKARESIGVGAKLIDIGAPFNFVDQHGNFNSLCGPMSPQQLAQMFRKDDGFPEVGLYYDIDYFLAPSKKYTDREILSTIVSFSTEAWSRHERIRQLILGV